MSPERKQEESLSGVVKILIVVLIVCLGLWGCARKPGTQTASTERVRVLESRCQKLEQDYRTIVAARDKIRKELSQIEEESAQVQKLLAQRTNERDDFKAQLANRSSERDVWVNRCERLRKGMQQLMQEEDLPNATSATVTPSPAPVGSE